MSRLIRFIFIILVSSLLATTLTGCNDKKVNESRSAVTDVVKTPKLLSSWCQVQAFGEVDPIKNSLADIGFIPTSTSPSDLTGVAPVSCDMIEKTLVINLDSSTKFQLNSIPMISGKIIIETPNVNEKYSYNQIHIEKLEIIANSFPTARVLIEDNSLSFEIVSTYPIFNSKGEIIDDVKFSSLLSEISELLASATEQSKDNIKFITI